MPRLGRVLAAHPWIVYAVLAALSFPILEIILRGPAALQYAHDVFDDDIPRLFSIAADWGAHGPVLWDPHLTAGNGLLTQFALPPLAPDVLLSFVLPPFTAYTLNAALMAFAAGVSMHLFLRDSLRLATVACFVGGIIATLAFWHYIYGYAALMLPLLLWSTDRFAAEGRRRRDIVIAVAIVTFLLFSSQIQIVLIDAVVVLGWVLLSPSSGRSRGVRVGTLVGIWGLAFMLAAPILASQVVAIPGSQRSIWALGTGFPLLGQLHNAADLYGRILFGVPLRASVGGSADIYGTYFLGALALPLLVIGCLVPRRTSRDRLLLALIVAIPVFDILAPLLMPLQENVGILRSMQFVRVRHLLPVVLTISAAIGADWLAGPDPLRRLGRTRRWLVAGGLAVVGAAFAWQVVGAVRHVLAGTGSDLNQEGWAIGLVGLLGGAILAGAIGLDVVRRIRRGGGEQAVLVGTLAVLLLVSLTGERLVMARAQRDLGPASDIGSWADRVAITPAQAFIASQPGGGRVLSMGDHANRALVAGLDAVDGYETIYPLRYHELFGRMIAPQLATDPFHDHYFNTWGNRAYAFGPELDMAVADLLGVRWLSVTGDLLSDPALAQRFTSGGVTVYENPAAFPRAFVAHRATVVADRPAVVAALGTATADELRTGVYVVAGDVPAGTPPLPSSDGAATAPAAAGDAATIETDAIDHLVIRARTATPGILVLADTWTPDWVAEIDGATTPVLPVDDALRGVVLPAGDHVVTFSYRPIATYAGIVLAVLAVLLLAGWLTLDGRGGRRRTRHGPAVSPPDRASAPPS